MTDFFSPRRAFCGQDVGVLTFQNEATHIPGDPAHAGSFSYPVLYRTVSGSYADLIEGGPAILDGICAAAEALRNDGVRAIIGNCGLLAIYQEEVARRVGIPFAASALSLVPSIWQMLGRSGVIGVITTHSKLLKRTHLAASGISKEVALSVQGMQDAPYFSDVVLKGNPLLNPERMCLEVLDAGEKLRRRCAQLRAVVVECNSLPTYSAELARRLGLPVFDIITAANMLAAAIAPPSFGFRLTASGL